LPRDLERCGILQNKHAAGHGFLILRTDGIEEISYAPKLVSSLLSREYHQQQHSLPCGKPWDSQVSHVSGKRRKHNFCLNVNKEHP
jgi:hypothetical protein